MISNMGGKIFLWLELSHMGRGCPKFKEESPLSLRVFKQVLQATGDFDG